MIATLDFARADGVLTDIASIRSLPRERAVQRLPVEIQGVIFFCYNTSDLFIIDNRQGIYGHLRFPLDAKLIPRDPFQPDDPKPGMLVKLKGVTGVGDYAPDTYPTNIEVVGSAPLPPCAPVSTADLETGSFDGQPVSIRGLRRSVWAMRTGILEGRTFVEALRHLAGRIEQTYSVPCQCTIQDDGSRVPEFEANQFLLFAQEAVANSLKHAHPQKLTISAIVDQQRITLTVTDDGSGFDAEKAPGPQQGHFGIMGMKERLNALGGTLVINSVPGCGASVQATFFRKLEKVH